MGTAGAAWGYSTAILAEDGKHWDVEHSVDWDPGHSRRSPLRVEWQERGVLVPLEVGAQPYRRGSGRELIERSLPYQLGAETSYELTPEGVRCTITLPISTTHREARHA